MNNSFWKLIKFLFFIKTLSLDSNWNVFSINMRRNFNPLPTIHEEDEEEEEEDDTEQQRELGAVGGHEEGPKQQEQIGFNVDFLKENGFDVIEYVNAGKFGTVYSAMANEVAIKFYPINQIPKGAVIGENVWQSGNHFYVERSLTGIKVAIKYIPPPQLQPWEDPQEEQDNQLLLGAVGGFIGLLSSDFPERFGHPLEEVRKLMKLNHPNLVEVYNVLEDEEMGVYIVMEYFEMNLKEWVKGMNENNVKLDDHSIQIFLSQMIDGISYLHRNHIYHNDLHEYNVMVTEDEEGSILMKIVDFGEAQYFSEYNSPEADIKGLGQLLRLVMTLHDKEYPLFREALDDFIYTCAKGVFGNMDEVLKEFECVENLLNREH